MSEELYKFGVQCLTLLKIKAYPDEILDMCTQAKMQDWKRLNEMSLLDAVTWCSN